ncbi:hypothetical protein J6590_073723 [Homalodisca vitripennis]|nr:hypothetical protein J6590_073723 [Homalodisca vitripennis]
MVTLLSEDNYKISALYQWYQHGINRGWPQARSPVCLSVYCPPHDASSRCLTHRSVVLSPRVPTVSELALPTV